jgi:uncharacterized membrane protein YbhN (UPF0104 family)
MDSLVRAFESLLDQLPAVAWTPLALALVLHLGRTAARSRAWRNVLAAAYPAEDVRWGSVFAAYAAGVGANTLVPARGGDLLRLYLARRAIPGSTYPTLVASLSVETVFDSLVGSLLLAWALAIGAFPGVDALSRLPSIDWLWVFHEPRLGIVIASAALALGFVLGIWAGRAGRSLGARLAQGVAILRTPRDYVRRVVLWQAVDWTLRLATVGLFLAAFGLPVTAENVGLVQVAQSLSTLLPLTPAGIGTEQALLVYVLQGEGSTGAILSFSVGMRAAIAAVNVAVAAAVLLVVLRTVRWRRALANAPDDPSAGPS